MRTYLNYSFNQLGSCSADLLVDLKKIVQSDCNMWWAVLGDTQGFAAKLSVIYLFLALHSCMFMIDQLDSSDTVSSLEWGLPSMI